MTEIKKNFKAIAAVLILTSKGIDHEYLTWQTETVGERGCLLESQCPPPPIHIVFILFTSFSAEHFCFITQ